MPTATVEEVQACLPELLRVLAPGEEVTIVGPDGRPVGRLLVAPDAVPVPGPVAGGLAGDVDDDLSADLDGEVPPELNPRMVELADRMDTLTPAERAELLAWVALARDPSVHPAEARVALPRLADVFPGLTDPL
jgi:antitoxin (DNA-binding transcriptional repressor) of toxin-antitoxin stability system